MPALGLAPAGLPRPLACCGGPRGRLGQGGAEGPVDCWADGHCGDGPGEGRTDAYAGSDCASSPGGERSGVARGELSTIGGEGYSTDAGRT